MHRPSLILTVVLLAALLPAATGCGQGSSGKPSVDVSGLPQALRYPYAQAVSVAAGTFDGAPATVYSFTTNAPIPPVTEYYRTKLAKWKDYPVSVPASGTAFGFTSPDGKRTIVVAVESGAAGKTNLTICSITK